MKLRYHNRSYSYLNSLSTVWKVEWSFSRLTRRVSLVNDCSKKEEGLEFAFGFEKEEGIILYLPIEIEQIKGIQANFYFDILNLN